MLGVSYSSLKININSNVAISDTEGRGCSGGLAAMSITANGKVLGLSVVLLNSMFKNVSSGHSRSSVSTTYGNSGAIRISAPGATASSGVVAQVHQGSFTSCSVFCSGGSCAGGAIGVVNALLNMSGIAFTANTATAAAGALYHQGSDDTTQSLIVNNCTFTGNTAGALP